MGKLVADKRGSSSNLEQAAKEIHMQAIARAPMLMVVILFCGCANKFNVQPAYCQSGGDHLAANDKITTNEFWRGVAAKRADSTKDWKLTNITFDPWMRRFYGTAVIGHEECFLVQPYRGPNGEKGVEVFLRTTLGNACDENLIDQALIDQIRGGACPGSHSGGWRAY